jgi:hypothetical protein
LHVLDASDGEKLWSLALGEAARGQAPAVHGEQVFVSGTELRAVHQGSSAAREHREIPVVFLPAVVGSLFGTAIVRRMKASFGSA